MIICSKCNKSLQISDFYVTSKRRSPYCKECTKQYNREHKYYRKFRIEHREEYNAKCRERNHTETNKRRRKQYDQNVKFPYHKIMDDAGIKRICVNCGSLDNLGVHHIDKNHENNDLTNLQWLCTSCHNKLHNIEKIPNLKRDSKGRFCRKE